MWSISLMKHEELYLPPEFSASQVFFLYRNYFSLLREEKKTALKSCFRGKAWAGQNVSFPFSPPPPPMHAKLYIILSLYTIQLKNWVLQTRLPPSHLCWLLGLFWCCCLRKDYLIANLMGSLSMVKRQVEFELLPSHISSLKTTLTEKAPVQLNQTVSSAEIRLALTRRDLLLRYS